MDTKLVYVLISNERDLYLEMTLLSVVSARMHNPDACIVLVTDRCTLDSCRQGLRKDFLAYFSEVVCVDTAQYAGPVKKSRYIKTTLRERISGDYLFVDTDTVICDDLSDIDHTEGEIAMARDMHFSREVLLYLWGDVFTRLGHDLETPQFYNSGAFYAKDTPAVHELYRLWHKKWLEAQSAGINVDQPPLMRSIKEAGLEITELPGVWNCQLTGSFIPYLADAKILHFHTGSSSRSFHKLADEELLRRIKEEGHIDDETYELLVHPKSAFNGDFILMNACEARHTDSALYGRMKLFRDKAPVLFRWLERFSGALMYAYGYMERRSMLKKRKF